MKELIRFRQFLAEGKITENVSPAVIGFLQKHVPEEAPGSWDDVNHEFVVPYNHEALDYSEDDVQDFLYDTGLTLADLPTEYVEIDNWSVEYRNRPATARNFAKYVPGKGLYYKTTTELAEGTLKGRSKQKMTEAMLDPELKHELLRLVPEEWEGSWDDVKNDFVVPFEDTYMIDIENVLDSEFWPDNINRVPTDWVLIDQFDLEDGRRPNDTYIARNFARLVPGEGIEIKATTDFAEGKINENFLARALANLGMSPEKLHELLDNVVDQLESTIPADKKEKFDQAVEITRDKIDRGAIQKPNQVIAVFKEIFV